MWLDGGDNESALACFEEACTVDGANASVYSCKAIALVKVSAVTMSAVTLVGPQRANVTVQKEANTATTPHCVIGG